MPMLTQSQKTRLGQSPVLVTLPRDGATYRPRRVVVYQ